MFNTNKNTANLQARLAEAMREAEKRQDRQVLAKRVEEYDARGPRKWYQLGLVGQSRLNSLGYLLWALFKLALMAAFAGAFVAAYVWVIRWGWNVLVPITTLPPINYPQAVGVAIAVALLARIFGGNKVIVKKG